MRRQLTSLFPFLSVLISLMGVLSFLSIAFLLLNQLEKEEAKPRQQVEISWVGAPEHVKPVLVECLEEGLRMRYRGGTFFHSRESLQNEWKTAKTFKARAELRRFFLTKNPNPFAQKSDFLSRIVGLEQENLKSEVRRQLIQYYPVFLVYPGGVDSYQLAQSLLKGSSSLAFGLEPMLRGWEIPYQ